MKSKCFICGKETEKFLCSSECEKKYEEMPGNWEICHNCGKKVKYPTPFIKNGKIIIKCKKCLDQTRFVK
ncbi:hypothetical protein HN592_03305 [Candidatus Woesearchaeota archaeon]|jgi:hypothetical protein|nr:hypothetical protein [Candidatus Woesearchaeota archaeon]MBT4368239.1 hypothetical protein [Candidatus Woesearchaeota archaeon]MBT4712728.1 hypothetical protein [Candidatus Woesearchaeota archaeon]MBT6639640.1 hypothetical protein [Candidatus Woesearchaeota archaeon]MBT7133812.1 hypothetical protein [Candidatus Woesearchaeota archaeon]